ncbi:hypothetical protein PV04_03291 [Phialophora macrospora]|uniref:Uncharacterized protein n=1 Tax=Phialophora macrospora TaxID=1851006 RepID=A0A0D2FRZ5_9EURO|nr:hypothetical protein PV04_03291 [Phialophora macrospora]
MSASSHPKKHKQYPGPKPGAVATIIFKIGNKAIQGPGEHFVESLKRQVVDDKKRSSHQFPYFITQKLAARERRAPILLRHPDCNVPPNIYATISYRGNNGYARDYCLPGVQDTNTPKEKAQMTTRVAIWVGHDVQLRNNPNKKSVVTLFFDDSTAIKDLKDRLLSYYAFINPASGTLDLHHFNRLQYCPANIFYDLDVLSNNWNNVVDEYLGLCISLEKVDQSRVLSPLQHVRALYQGATEISIVKEDVEFHRVVRKKLMMFVDSRLQELNEEPNAHRETVVAAGGNPHKARQRTQEMRANVRFRDRLEDLGDDLDAYSSRLDMLAGRLQSLSDLQFTVLSAKTDINMAQLTNIMYLLTPIAFVAAIWGMTEFHTDPVYFLPVMLVVFVLSALWLVIHQRIVNNVHRNFRLSIHQNRLSETPYYKEAIEWRQQHKREASRDDRDPDIIVEHRRHPSKQTPQVRPSDVTEGHCVVVDRRDFRPRS